MAGQDSDLEKTEPASQKRIDDARAEGNVARSPEEAELQAQGVDVMAEMFEKDVAGFTEDRDPNAEPGEIPTDGGEEETAAA